MPEPVKDFGWADANATCAHPYLLPTLVPLIMTISSGAPLRILDLGCGNGFVASELARRGHRVVGIDGSADGIAIAKAAFPEVTFAVASLETADLDDLHARSVDCVVAVEVVEHLYDPSELFRKSNEALRPGGWLILSTPYHGYAKNLALSLANRWDDHFHVDRRGGHIKFFSPRTLAKMAREHQFENLRFRFVGRLPLLWKSMILCANKKAVSE